MADGLEALAGAELPYWTIQLCRTGLAVEAAAAGPGRGRHSGGEYQAIRERAAGLLDRIRSASSAPDVALTPAASVLTAEAEWSRVDGPSDPQRWASSAEAWEALSHPWPSAYARWRQAEALLAARAPRDTAGAALAQAWTLASTHGAALLVTEIQALAAARGSRCSCTPGCGSRTRPGAAHPPRSRRWSRKTRWTSCRGVPDPAHHRAPPGLLQHRRAVGAVHHPAATAGDAQPLPRGRVPARLRRGRDGAGVVAPRVPRGAGPRRRDPPGRAGVHDPALPRAGRDQHPHPRHLGPEVGHGRVQGHRHPGGQARCQRRGRQRL